MRDSMTVFEKTYGWYLKQLAACDFLGRAERLGARVGDEALVFSFLNDPIAISRAGVIGPGGQAPGFSECIVLMNYILRCPETLPATGDWVTYREVKGSGPLAVYFSENAVKPLQDRFAGNVAALEAACSALGGRKEPGTGGYDFSATFFPLPRVPLNLRFNDADEEFPASCTLLFTSDVSAWLDPESLAILAVLFAQKIATGDP
ncbi:DUF3786 domain-containing protein [Desulfoluna spongiiphila]|nr:DUF3786 domain-containing protein [Desulfoluna spongiiphila]VVS90638.1 domain of unknown function duf3786 [Desulfoluna spongiiphila]